MLKELNCYIKAMQQPKWCVVMTAELTTLISHGTWIPKPPNANVIGNKWVFKLKHKADGLMERCKVRLVAKGYT
jgi:hypothetical protein